MIGRVDVWVAAPAIVATLMLGAIEAYRFVRPAAPLFTKTRPASLTDAIVEHHLEAAYAFVRAGQDPNLPIQVSDPQVTGGRTVAMSPLLLAVAAHDTNGVLMLLSSGADLSLPENRLALCLAQEKQDEEIAGILSRAAPTTTTCPEHVLEP